MFFVHSVCFGLSRSCLVSFVSVKLWIDACQTRLAPLPTPWLLRATDSKLSGFYYGTWCIHSLLVCLCIYLFIQRWLESVLVTAVSVQTDRMNRDEAVSQFDYWSKLTDTDHISNPIQFRSKRFSELPLRKAQIHFKLSLNFQHKCCSWLFFSWYSACFFFVFFLYYEFQILEITLLF